MIVGTLRITAHLPGVHSLKEKRRIVKGLKDRLHARFNVAVAEVDHQDVWQTAEIGVAAVGNESRHVGSVLDEVLNAVRASGVSVSQVEREVL